MYKYIMHTAACRGPEGQLTKHHHVPIKTQIWKAYVTARLFKEIILSNEITGSVSQSSPFP